MQTVIVCVISTPPSNRTISRSLRRITCCHSNSGLFHQMLRCRSVSRTTLRGVCMLHSSRFISAAEEKQQHNKINATQTSLSRCVAALPSLCFLQAQKVKVIVQVRCSIHSCTPQALSLTNSNLLQMANISVHLNPRCVTLLEDVTTSKRTVIGLTTLLRHGSDTKGHLV